MSKRSGQTGSLALRKDKWVARFYVDEAEKRKRRAVILGTRRELTRTQARLKMLNIIAEAGVNEPTHLERCLRPPTTFNDVADAWEQKRLPHLKLSTQYGAPKIIANHLRPFFGKMAVEDIKTGTINDWIAKLVAKGLAPKTILNRWKDFSAIIRWHAQQNDEQPRKWYPSLPALSGEEQRWFNQEEMERIIEAASDQHKALFHLAGTTGLRAGELFGLHVEDLDTKRGVLHVRRSMWNGIELGVKTLKGYRAVWLDSATVRMLVVFLKGRSSGRIFQTSTGGALNTSNVLKHVLYPICDRLGIKRGGLHAFRHGRVSHLQRNGAPVDFTKSQIGHSNLRTTSMYTHFSEKDSREIAERMSPSWTQVEQLDSHETTAKLA